MDELDDQGGPAGLMAGAQARAVVAVEILEERDIVAPVRISLEEGAVAQNRPAIALVAGENRDQTPGELGGDLGQRRPLRSTARQSSGQARAVVAMILPERLDHQIVDRKPDRAAPVGITAIDGGRRLGRLVRNPIAVVKERLVG